MESFEEIKWPRSCKLVSAANNPPKKQSDILSIVMTSPVDNTAEQLESVLAGVEKNKKVLKQDLSLLREFDSNEHKDVLVLYHHVKDSAFDAFNAEEYTQQLLQYYAKKITVKVVVPRTIGNNKYFLVCLQHEVKEYNSLCQLAFQCKRQFVGYSMLVKKKCFACNKTTNLTCAGCKCACFCSKECQASSFAAHKKLCKLIRASNAQTEEESLDLVEAAEGIAC
jgi:hypothetical protein